MASRISARSDPVIPSSDHSTGLASGDPPATTAQPGMANDDTKEDEVRPIWQISMDSFPLLDDIKEAAKKDEVYQQQLALPHPRTDGLTVGGG